MSPRTFVSAVARRLGLTIAPPVTLSPTHRARLSVTALEDRSLPALVSGLALLEVGVMGPQPGVAGVGVVLTSHDGTWAATSGDSGAFSLGDVAPGSYAVSVSAPPGYAVNPDTVPLTLAVGDTDVLLGIELIGSGTGSGTGREGDIGTRTGVGTGHGSDTGTGTGSGSGTGTGGTGSGTGIESGTGTGSGTDTGSGTGAGTGDGCGTGTGSGSGTDIGTGTGSGTGSGTGTGTGTGTSRLSGSLTAVRPDGTEAEEGWVSENNDNDNYNFYGDPDTSLDQIPDDEELGQVEGEDDLVPIRIGVVEGASAGDVVSLDFASTNIRLWTNADKSGGQVTPATTFDPSVPHTVYVEGLALSSAVNAESISLMYTGAALAGPPLQGVLLATLPLTVYRVTGAGNVPGYSRHTYETIVPGQVGATYGAITGGTQHSVTPSVPTAGGTNTSNTLIVNWSEGEVVGTYRVNLPAGFGVTRQVNVVKVQLDINGADNKLVPGGTQQAQSNNDPRFIDSAPRYGEAGGDPTVYASLNVSRIAGPLVGEQRRGQRFIDVGFVQTVKHVKQRGDYISAIDFRPFSAIASTEGKTYIDVAGNGTAPWYFDNYAAQVGERRYKAIQDGAPVLNLLFDMDDAVAWRAVQNMVEEGSMVHRFRLNADFMLYFAVHTTEAVNAANESYTIRASIPWSWNGSGNVDGGEVNIAPGLPVPTGKWKADNYPNGPVSTTANPKRFVEVATGDIVSTALTKGITSNAAMTAMTWTLNPPLFPPIQPPPGIIP
jgi:hypothetical protein